MTGKQHMRMGIAAGAGIMAYVVLSQKLPIEATTCMLTTPIGAMLPDMDSATSKLGRTTRRVSKVTSFMIAGVLILALLYTTLSAYKEGGGTEALLNLVYFLVPGIILWIVSRNPYVQKAAGFVTGHRGFLHTNIPIALLIGATLWLKAAIATWLLYGVALGCVVHLFGDMWTVEGAPILWPLLRSNIRVASLSAKNTPNALQFVCNLWSILFIVAGIYLGVTGGL